MELSVEEILKLPASAAAPLLTKLVNDSRDAQKVSEIFSFIVLFMPPVYSFLVLTPWRVATGPQLL